MSGHSFQQLVLGERATEAEADERRNRKRTRTFGRERPLAVERVVGVDGLPVVVGGDGDAATQVAHDEAKVLIVCVVFAGVTTSNGLLVERMPDADARQQR